MVFIISINFYLSIAEVTLLAVQHYGEKLNALCFKEKSLAEYCTNKTNFEDF